MSLHLVSLSSPSCLSPLSPGMSDLCMKPCLLLPFHSMSTSLLPSSTQSIEHLSSPQRRKSAASRIQCVPATSTEKMDVPRRSANYNPNVWDYDFIQSLDSPYTDGAYKQRTEDLINIVRDLLLRTSGPLARLELINDLQRLGVWHHFEKEIRLVLDTISTSSAIEIDKDLHATALQFLILRQYGYRASTDVFNSFIDDKGSFKTCLCEDTKGLLSLYEASYLAFPGETIMDEAKAFTKRHLKNLKGSIDPKLEEQVNHALELPVHYRMARLEARWYTEMYGKEEHVNPLILELAKLDFNLLQASYQRDAQNGYRWWKQLGLAEKLPFFRDRWMECFMFALSITWEPQFGYGREVLAKINQMVTVIDDIYDVYGSVEELELFTDAIERWETSAIEQLPEYMKISYLTVLNFSNDLGYDVLKEQGWNAIPCLNRMWADLCKAYLVEAKWYHNGYTPTLDEYLNNAWVSISGCNVLAHGYFGMRLKLTKDIMEGIENYAELLQCASMILRLCDDMGTSSDELARGDVLKSIQCFMHEANVSEAVAREHIRRLTDEVWKKMNKKCVDGNVFPRFFVDAALGLGRRAESVYLKGDGFGAPDSMANGHVTSLVVEPITINNV